MSSEIRVNKIANRVGLSTVEYTDTGIIVSGIVTCTEISGLNALNIAGVSTFASPLDINGDIDVDGHTNLDNLSVAGVSTFTGAVNTTNVVVGDFLNVGSNIKLGNAGVVTATSYRGDGSQLTGIVAGLSTISGVVNVANDLDVDGHTNLDNVSIAGVTTFSARIDTTTINISANNDIRFASGNWSGNITKIQNHNNYLYIVGPSNGFQFRIGATDLWLMDSISNDGNFWPTVDSGRDIGKSNRRVRNVYATTLYGDGSNLSNLPAGAPVGGASTNTVFFENDKEVAVNYQITSTKNAMSAGPISINAGIAVTVPSGCSWTIV